tara:strand:+ start:645 stop:908 length:264 start_codon:yes stop_codon:yes gene_type:complete
MVNRPQRSCGRVAKIAKMIVDNAEAKQIVIGIIIFFISSELLAKNVMITEMMIALIDIKMVDLLSAIEFKLICVLEVVRNIVSTPLE